MSSENIERSIAGLNLTTRAETDRRILDDAYAALGKTMHKQRTTKSTGVRYHVLRSRFAVPAAIAAVILLAFALFINTQTEKGIKVERIYGALSEAKNVQISKFRPGRTNPEQQIWVSKNLGVKLLKTGLGNQAQYTLWDMKNRVRMIKFLSSDSVKAEPITQQMLAELEKSVAEVDGLVPFSNKKDIPEDAQWSRIDDQAVLDSVSGAKAYDLTWMEKSVDSRAVIYRKWRVFADNHTNLPERMEWYSKSDPEDEYGFEEFVVVVYPSEDEITSIIRKIFGRPDNPEYIGTPEAYR